MVVADHQTRGRGRLGRSWSDADASDERGGDLLFSVVLRPPLAPRALPPLALAVAVALAETVEAHGGAARLKWPNDLLVDGRKLAGILTELSTSGQRIGHVIVGIGVNLNRRRFAPPLDATATSLALATGAAVVDRSAFAATLCQRLEAWHDRFVTDGPATVVAAWRARSATLGRDVTVTNGTEVLHGRAEDLDEDGALLLRTAEGLVRVLAGDVTWTE